VKDQFAPQWREVRSAPTFNTPQNDEGKRMSSSFFLEYDSGPVKEKIESVSGSAVSTRPPFQNWAGAGFRSGCQSCRAEPDRL